MRMDRKKRFGIENLEDRAMFSVNLAGMDTVAAAAPQTQAAEVSTQAVHVVQESEPNNTKASADRFNLAAGNTAQLVGTSRNHDDKDFFVFRPTTNGVLQIRVASTNGRFAQLEIENARGIELFETEPNDGVNSGRLNVVAGQNYFIRLRATGNQPAGYRANLTLTSATTAAQSASTAAAVSGDVSAQAVTSVQESEPNNTKANADRFTLTSGNTVQLIGTSRSHDDKDYFVFRPTTSGVLRINVASTNGRRAQLEIENARGVELFETEPNDGINSGRLNVVAGQTYFVRLRAPGGQPAGYRASLTLG